MAAQSFVVACTVEELAFLTGLLGAEVLLGLPDPFKGCSTDEVDAVWSRAQETLARRGVINVLPDGSLALGQDVAALVGTCGFAEATFLAVYHPAGGEVEERHFHMMRDAGVELVLKAQADVACTLMPLDDAGLVLPHVLELFQLSGQPSLVVPNGSLQESVLREAASMALTSGEAIAANFLVKAGLHEATATALAVTLARPVANGALTAVGPDRDEAEERLGLLEGENGLWLLRQGGRRGAQWVDVVPCSAEDMGEFIRSVMRCVWSGNAL